MPPRRGPSIILATLSRFLDYLKIITTDIRAFMKYIKY